MYEITTFHLVSHIDFCGQLFGFHDDFRRNRGLLGQLDAVVIVSAGAARQSVRLNDATLDAVTGRMLALLRQKVAAENVDAIVTSMTQL